MRQNFGRDKRRLEELKKKRREEKQLKKQNKSAEAAVPPAPTEGTTPGPEALPPA